MIFGNWNMRRRCAMLLGIFMIDGALLGAAAGVGGWRAQGAGGDGACLAADSGGEYGRAEQKMVALTFDDGPHETCTPMLLDGLKKRGVHATFFLMGENIAGKEDLVRRIRDEGHLIGNHSYRHIQLTKAGEDAVCESIEKTGQIIADITGTRPQYLRPPYGDWNEALECRLDLTTVFWTVDSLDWKLQDTSKIVSRVLKRADNSDIILMHDIFPTSVEAALQIVDALQAQGYTFVTVDELMID